MIKKFVKCLIILFHITVSHAGFKFLDIEIGKTNITELMEKKFKIISTSPHNLLNGYTYYSYKIPQKVYGSSVLTVAASRSGIIESINLNADRNYFEKIFLDLLENNVLVNVTETENIKNHMFKNENTIIFLIDVNKLYLRLEYNDSGFTMREHEAQKMRTAKKH